jgi:hypothetical protein
MSASKKIRVLILITIPVIAAVIAVANTSGIKKWLGRQSETSSGAADKTDKKDPAQVALMNEMMAWLKPFDTTNTSYYLNGLLTAVDKTDSANAMIDIAYTVCKNGKQFYLQMGKTETINNDQHYLFVDHTAQKILLANSKEVIQSPGLPVNDLYDYITSEGYVFSKEAGGNRLYTITMQNPNHISCKELSVQYDSVTRQVKRIFTRQAEVTDPMNQDKEKWITLTLKDWNDDPDPAPYLNVQKFIEKREHVWVTAPACQDYELINQ